MRNQHYIPLPQSNNELFKIKTYIRYTEAKVEYIPGLWNVLKWAWVQYASALIIFIYLTEGLKTIVFGQRMIPTWNETKMKSISH